MTRPQLLAVLAQLILPGAIFAQAAPERVDLSQFPAAAVEDVVIPVPSEVFNVLDKLGSPNWKAQVRQDTGRNTGNRAQVALLLGTVIADGFVAVEAEDSEKVKNLGRQVLELSDAIGVRKAVIARSKSITEKADARQWPAVRKEFDGALQDVRGAMMELNDGDLAQLVSLGGWVRGTQVLTSIVAQDYKPDGAELLHQPELLNYFSRRIDSMSPRLRKEPLVSGIRKMLGDIKPIISRSSGADIKPAEVTKINEQTSAIVQSISTGDNP